MCVYTYTYIYNVALNREEILTPAATRMDLEDIRLSEISQSHKDKYSMTPLI